MSDDFQHAEEKKRKIGQPATVCFVVSGVAFVASGMAFFVNHYLSGALAISGTLAIGLMYLALGILNLGMDPEMLENGGEVTDAERGAYGSYAPPRESSAVRKSAARDARSAEAGSGQDEKMAPIGVMELL